MIRKIIIHALAVTGLLFLIANLYTRAMTGLRTECVDDRDDTGFTIRTTQPVLYRL